MITRGRRVTFEYGGSRVDIRRMTAREMNSKEPAWLDISERYTRFEQARSPFRPPVATPEQPDPPAKPEPTPEQRAELAAAVAAMNPAAEVLAAILTDLTGASIEIDGRAMAIEDLDSELIPEDLIGLWMVWITASRMKAAEKKASAA